ncbi:MAG TPA: zinc-binding dehydrogenase [Thermoguttaceae bacterium]|nr:zinc-binding dehydrogenase [Thermoguttaceae bacterium]
MLFTDLSDYRLAAAYQCGLDNTSNVRNEPLGEAARRVFGDDGFDVAIECVGVEATVDAAIENIAKGGRIVAVGNFPEKPRVNVSLIQDRELSLIGTLMYKHEDYHRAVELLDAGAVVTGPLETKHFPFERYLEAYQYILGQNGRCMKVFIDL